MPFVQIVGPEDGWILERLARKLAVKLPYADFVPWRPAAKPETAIIYYVNYALYERPSGLIDVGFFTHLDTEQRFLERARAVHCSVCMARGYAEWLRAQGVRDVVHIPMGFDSYRFRPRLILGVVGRVDHPRKGKELIERLRAVPFVDVKVTEGKLPAEQLAEFYERLDYVLVPSTVEGGPMSVLEGLGVGKAVIAPDGVGVVPEFSPTPYIRRYPPGDAEKLVEVVMACYREKQEGRNLVAGRTWDDWAAAHHRLFARLAREHGQELPVAADGFRFGMMGEIDLPFGIDLEPLEDAVDRSARSLFHGQYDEARGVLQALVPRFPCLRKLLDTLPRVPPGRRDVPRVRALR